MIDPFFFGVVSSVVLFCFVSFFSRQQQKQPLTTPDGLTSIPNKPGKLSNENNND